MKFNFGLLPALTLFGSLSVITARMPILLVPGLTGSQLRGTVDSEWEDCSSLPENFLLWFGLGTLYCPTALELQYNESTNTYSDKQGVSVSVPGFKIGKTITVECIGGTLGYGIFCLSPYLRKLVKHFVDKFGYKRGETIRAAPYDWRLAADSFATQGYFNNLRGLVEEMYNKNEDTPVALVAHSMGGPMTLYFLNEVVNQTWKNKYIGAYIPLSGAFGGASRSLGALVSGIPPFNIPASIIDVELMRSLESIYWLMPRAEVYGDQVLVQTPKSNYTAMNYQLMFTKFANYPLGWTKYNATSSINASFPQVPTYCFYGSEVDTPLTYVYSRNCPTEKPTVIMGSGDGVVNKVSLEVCLRWANSTTGNKFQYRAFPGVDHLNMVKNTSVLDEIAKIVMAGPPTGSVIPRVNIHSTRFSSPSSSVIARVDIYSTMILIASAFIIMAVM